MKLWQRVLGVETQARHSVTTIDDYFTYMSNAYPLGALPTSIGNLSEEPPVSGFEAFADRVFKAHPVVYGAERFRKAVFSQARYKWQNLSTNALFGQNAGLSSLAILERPWPGGTTSCFSTATSVATPT